MVCFVDYRTTYPEKEKLSSLGLEIIEIPICNDLYESINGHVDIQFNILDKKSKKVIINKNINNNFKNNLKDKGITYIESKNSLKYNYPNDIILNALILEKYFIHNLKFTDENLLNDQKDKILINVKQGYTKCSCLYVSDKALITNDSGIYNSLCKYDFDILLLPPGDIILEGLNYGFIGGTGGLINNNTMAFFGDLNHYKYGNEVISFLSKYNVKPIYLKNSKLTDRGSLFVI
ncbi:DUF6873 family GME fold protein [Clostridium nigeriense]|uniref:DUF6873 family GME fold protein n=1 Tax=Clostridium nigeriense TaxID=1805470 RepID=UPI003D340F79